MLKNRNIAFFIDVDNVGLNSEQYLSVMDKLNGCGAILSGKIYGAGERKHKEIYADADVKGYTTLRPMRIKRRGRKEFDARIYVDVVDAVSHAQGLDTVCIVAQPTDLIHLYSYLHSHGVKVIALANADEASNALIDEVLDIGIAPPPAKPTQKQPAKAPVKKPANKPTPTNANTDDLLREIEHLKNIADETNEEPAPAKPVQKQPAKKAPAKQPAKQAETAKPTQSNPAYEAPSSERDLIKRIEEIRNGSKGEDDDLVDEIKKLLDGLE